MFKNATSFSSSFKKLVLVLVSLILFALALTVAASPIQDARADKKARVAAVEQAHVVASSVGLYSRSEELPSAVVASHPQRWDDKMSTPVVGVVASDPDSAGVMYVSALHKGWCVPVKFTSDVGEPGVVEFASITRGVGCSQ